MRSAIHVSAILLVLGGALGLITAPHSIKGIGQTAATSDTAIIDDFDQDVTGSIAPAQQSRLSLNDEQRGFIFLGVINLPDVPEVFLHMPVAGAPLPEFVELHDMPAMVLRRVPQVSGYKFAKLDDRILVVSPDTRQIADMIPRYKLVFH